MVEALGDFDPKATYDAASREYEQAMQRYWAYLSDRVVDLLALRPGERVLDAPCGTGPSVVAAARAVGAGGRVVGVDYAEQMLAIAREKVATAGLGNVALEVRDLTAISAGPDGPYDAVVCVFGLFFVDDMAATLRSFHDLVRPGGGRVGIGVFGERVFDPMCDVFAGVVEEVVPGFDVVLPWRRLESDDALQAVVDGAGLVDVDVELSTFEDELPLPSADAWWQLVMGSGMRRTVTAIGPAAADEVRARCSAVMAERGVDRIVNRTRALVLTRR